MDTPPTTPKPFDTATKELVALRPSDWLPYLGLRPAEVDLFPTDLATILPAADHVIRVRRRRPWLLHLESQASYDLNLPRRVLRYSVLIEDRHELPVRSVVLLLRPDADGPAMTGKLERRLPGGRRYLTFRYEVVRAWEKSVEEVLAGGLATLPMAPIAAVAEEELPAVIRRMEERIREEATPGEAIQLWSAAYLLLGLRLDAEAAGQLLQGVRAMKESTTYQAILREGREEGRAEEAQRILLRLGTKRFGPPSEQERTTIEGVTAIGQLELLSDRLLDVESWAELLAE